MKSWILSAFVMAVSLSASADGDSQKWEKLLGHIVQDGQTTETPQGVFRTLQRIEPQDPTRPRRADFIRTVGGFDGNGVYRIRRIESVSENWRIDPKSNWDIDQWLFKVSAAGDLQSASHVHLVKTPSGSVLVYDSLKEDASELDRQWKNRLEAWYPQ